MRGRVENEQRMDAKIIEKLRSEPSYMTDYMQSFVRKSYTTKNAYIGYVLEFIHYLEETFGYNINDVNMFVNVKPSMINGYMNYLTRVEKTMNNGMVVKNGASIQCKKFYAIKDFFKFLLNDDYITKNPCDNIDPPKVDTVIDVVAMDKEEINLFLSNVINGVGTQRSKSYQAKWKNRDYAVMTLALSLGLRVTSISEINVEDIDFDSNCITVTEKGNNTRKLLFSNNLKAILLEWMKDRNQMLGSERCDALFISNQKKRLCDQSIANLVTKYSRGIDKHITPHKLRSTCATNIYSATGDIYLTADVIGHRNIQNTRRYAKVVDEQKQKAIQAMDKIMFG